MFLGTYGIDEYVAIPAVTHRFSSGAAYAPTAITYSIYEEGNTTGLDENVDMTPASPFDGVTGLYYARRQLTAAAGFENNKTYVVVVKATVDSVAAIDAHVFQIRPLQTGDSYAIVSHADYGNAKLVRSTTPANTLTVDANHLVAVPATQKVDVDTIKTQAVTCAAGVTVLASVGTAATSTAQTGDSYARLGAPAGASVSADVAAIKAVADTIQADTDLLDDASGGLADIHTDIADLHTDIAAIKTVVDTIQADTDLLDDVSGGLADIHTDVGSVKTVVDAIKLKTDNLPADPADDSDIDTQLAATKAVVDAIKVITDAIGATGSGLTAIPWNAAWDAEVQSECTDALNAYDPPTKAELDSAQAAVTVSAIANNAITAAAIATDAIDADALKADAITEIQNGLATAAALTTVDTVVDLIEDIVRNKMEITDANGNLVLYADDSTTPLYSVAACVTDDLTTTTRKRLA